jgi:phosphoribosyl-ATP pyrophosphohydrolase/phosphoribosyl-AMP cyclohydrolase
MSRPASDSLAWDKGDGLLPAVVQHADDGRVLMLGFMNRAALDETLRARRVTFWSRSRGRLWTKGESSGNVLDLVAIDADCDRDTLLVQARPRGPVCHLGTPSCFGGAPGTTLGFLAELERLIAERERTRPGGSYTSELFAGGLRRIAQKLGEEGVETALAAVAQDDAALLDESADLVYHLLVLLRARGLGLDAVVARLLARHAASGGSSSSTAGSPGAGRA